MSDKTIGKCCKVGEGYCNQPVLYPLGRDRLIYVDRCMIPELQSLWNRGIKTGGCCCGHGEDDGFIQVSQECVEAMLELGYEEIPPVEVNGYLMGENVFKPKTQFEFNGYMIVKTELKENYERLEQRYQQLAQVAREMVDDLEDLPSGADDYRKKLEELGVEL
mgnify:CR=1 FL=1